MRIDLTKNLWRESNTHPADVSAALRSENMATAAERG